MNRGARHGAERRAGVMLLATALWLGHGCAGLPAGTSRPDRRNPIRDFTASGNVRPRVVTGVHAGVTDRDGVPVHWYEFQGALAGESRWLRVGIAAAAAGGTAPRAWVEEFTPPGGSGPRRPALLDLVDCRPQAGPPSATGFGDPGGDPYPLVLRLRVCDTDAEAVQVAWGPDWTWATARTSPVTSAPQEPDEAYDPTVSRSVPAWAIAVGLGAIGGAVACNYLCGRIRPTPDAPVPVP